VVLLDPSQDTVVGLNPFRSRQDPEVVADGLLGVLHQLFESSWGPRTSDIAHASLLTLARAGGQSLVGLPLLLTNPRFRRRLTASLDDPLGVSGFWAWFESISESERMTAIGPVMNKLRQLMMRPALRSVLGQAAPRFDIADVFRHRRIVVVSLSSGLLGPEAANLFGALVLHQLWQATLARTNVPAEQRHPVMAYLDEFQEYLRLPVNLTDMLVQARSLGLGLTLAHQHLGQLSTSVREAVQANAASSVMFRLQPGDAAVMAHGYRQLDAEDITGLGAYEVYADLLSGGVPTGPMSGRTQPAPEVTSDPGQVRAESLKRWGTPRADIEGELRALIEPSGPASKATAETTIGVRKRTRGGDQ